VTYRVSATGKQYLVIAAHPKITEEKLGDSLSAFALP
jgi:glucose dehydrogenase